ncbi:hypothetical protein SO694_000011132 [Aureococcus anophagefferens]|uniref:Hexosyltransferase n=1 Tax=Aureococcus anophagefferens TaxID=44056 RepID=A0ABR1GCK1_AURAN
MAARRAGLLLWLLGAAAGNAREPAPRCGVQNFPHDPQKTTRIAIALFGLLRSNSTMANFETFMLAPLLAHRPEPYTVDVFLHLNVVAKITNARTNERAQALPAPLAWTRLAPCRYALEDQNVLDVKLGRLRHSLSRERKRDLYKDHGASLQNLFRALHSLKETARLIEARELALDLRYDVVASVRVDTIFTRSVPGDVYAYVKKSPVAKLFVPHFGCSIQHDLLLNDRFAVGAREAMLHVYLPRIDTVANFTSADDRGKSGLSGERHLFNAVKARGVPTARMHEFCLRRVRAGGQIWVKVFTPRDDRTCPLEALDVCDDGCMERQPACAAGRGCHQRGVHIAARLFDGEGWCDPHASTGHACRFDYEKLGFGLS